MDRLKPVEHGFKSFVFSVTKVLLARKNREQRQLDPTRVQSVLLLPPGRLGDMVSVLPLAEGFRTLFPHIRIGVVASPSNAMFIRDDPRFHRVFLYRKNLFSDIAEVRSIRREKYDCVVDMICNDSVTSLYLSQLCASGKPRIGLGKTKFREFYDFAYDKGSDQIMRVVVRALEAFGIDSNTVNCYAPPFLSDKEITEAARFVAEIAAHQADRPLIGYNLSAGASSRQWPIDRAKALMHRILDQYPHGRILITSMPWDREQAESLTTPDRRIVLFPAGLQITGVSAILARLDLLISPDTSLVHIARSFRVPVVGLYTRCDWNLAMWRPYGQTEGIVVAQTEHNIHDITVDEVFDSLVTVLSSCREVAL